MAETTNPLNRIEVASPCTQSWDAMTGDDKRRYCGECRLHVHNLSAMTSSEAEDVLENAGDRLCVRYFRRPDGTVLTQDCVPVRERLRRRVRRLRVAAAALLGFLYPLSLAGCGGTASDDGAEVPTTGAIAVEHEIGSEEELEPLMGEPLMGDVALPAEELKEPEAEGCDHEPDSDSGADDSEGIEKAKDAFESTDEPVRETIGRMIIR